MQELFEKRNFDRVMNDVLSVYNSEDPVEIRLLNRVLDIEAQQNYEA